LPLVGFLVSIEGIAGRAQWFAMAFCAPDYNIKAIQQRRYLLIVKRAVVQICASRNNSMSRRRFLCFPHHRR
jgi:hypothetical protein